MGFSRRPRPYFRYMPYKSRRIAEYELEIVYVFSDHATGTYQTVSTDFNSWEQYTEDGNLRVVPHTGAEEGVRRWRGIISQNYVRIDEHKIPQNGLLADMHI